MIIRKTYWPESYQKLFGYDEKQAREAALRDRDTEQKRIAKKGWPNAVWVECGEYVLSYNEPETAEAESEYTMEDKLKEVASLARYRGNEPYE